MKKQIVGLAVLLSACTPQKEVLIPKVTIPEIKLQERVVAEAEPEPQKDDETAPSDNEYRNLGESCNQVQLESGKYPVKMKGWDATYNVSVWDRAKDCFLVISNSEITAQLVDSDCDNTTNRVDIEEEYSPSRNRINLSLDRATLEHFGYKKSFDRLLEDAQQFVCPENKGRLQEYLLKKVLETGK